MVQRRIRQGLVGFLGAAVVVLLAAAPAGAERAVALGEDGVLVEPGAEEVDRGALAAAVQRVRSSGVRLSVAVLAQDPPGGAEAEANRLVDQAGGGVVLVLAPGEVAAGSADHTDRQVDAALDAAGTQFEAGGDIPAGVETFGDRLAGAGAGGLDTTDLPGPLSGVSVPTLIVGGIVLLVVLSLLSRVLGGGRRRRARGIGGIGSSGGYGSGGYGSRGRRRRGGGGLAGGFLGGMAGGALGGRHRGGTGRSSSSTRSSGSSSRSGGSSSRSRGSASRSRGSSSRSRGSSSRRR